MPALTACTMVLCRPPRQRRALMMSLTSSPVMPHMSATSAKQMTCQMLMQTTARYVPKCCFGFFAHQLVRLCGSHFASAGVLICPCLRSTLLCRIVGIARCPGNCLQAGLLTAAMTHTACSVQLFLARIPHTATDGQTQELFGQYGTVKEVTLFRSHPRAPYCNVRLLAALIRCCIDDAILSDARACMTLRLCCMGRCCVSSVTLRCH